MSAKSFGPPEHDSMLTHIVIVKPEARQFVHFLPPGVACTTGLSHNPFTWRPLKDRKNAYARK